MITLFIKEFTEPGETVLFEDERLARPLLPFFQYQHPAADGPSGQPVGNFRVPFYKGLDPEEHIEPKSAQKSPRFIASYFQSGVLAKLFEFSHGEEIQMRTYRESRILQVRFSVL